MVKNDAFFPKNPQFSPFSREKTPAAWGTLNAHDPSLLETEGAFYAFSTGNNGQDNYQIRRSPDLVHWQYVGQAFPDPAALSPVFAQLGAVYGKPVENTTLWAPDVVPAAGGGFWLYGCYTAVFGNNYSVMFLAHSPRPCGPYRYVAALAVSGGNWGETPNAIDPQIFYDRSGRMFCAYGSFFGGIRVLELNPATGVRLDGFTFEEYRAGKISERQYYGGKLLDSDDAEGSVVAFRRGVPVYPRVRIGEPMPAPQCKDFYYLMASRGSLFRDYTMRLWRSSAPAEGFAAGEYGRSGKKLSGSCTWRRSPAEEGFDFFAPGHNDIFRTSDGRELLVYHNRTAFGEGWPHYLFLGLAAYNGDGDLVFSLNRYAGERLRRIEREELAAKAFDYILLNEDDETPVYARSGLCLREDGVMTLGGAAQGRWRLFGEYCVDIEWGGSLFRGAAMPAWLEREGRAGITISLLGRFPLFLNQTF